MKNTGSDEDCFTELNEIGTPERGNQSLEGSAHTPIYNPHILPLIRFDLICQSD